MHTHYGCEFTAQRDGTAGGYRFGRSIQIGRGETIAVTAPPPSISPILTKSWINQLT